MMWRYAGAGGAALGLAVLWLRSRLLVVTVHGVSMAPTYRSGDRLLVWRARLPRVRRNAVVVVTQAGRPDQLTVKRAVAVPGDPVPEGMPQPEAVVPPGHLIVVGDNAAHSYDSRRTGYYTAGSLVGVVLRSLPPAWAFAVDLPFPGSPLSDGCRGVAGDPFAAGPPEHRGDGNPAGPDKA